MWVRMLCDQGLFKGDLNINHEQSHTTDGENVNKTSDISSELIEGVFSDDITRQIIATQSYRKLLSIACNPPIGQKLYKWH